MRRRGRGGAKAALGGRAAAVNAAATKAVRNATVTGKPAAPATAQTADKIMVSGLPTDVNEAQIKASVYSVYDLRIVSNIRPTGVVHDHRWPLEGHPASLQRQWQVEWFCYSSFLPKGRRRESL